MIYANEEDLHRMNPYGLITKLGDRHFILETRSGPRARSGFFIFFGPGIDQRLIERGKVQKPQYDKTNASITLGGCYPYHRVHLSGQNREWIVEQFVYFAKMEAARAEG